MRDVNDDAAQQAVRRSPMGDDTPYALEYLPIDNAQTLTYFSETSKPSGLGTAAEMKGRRKNAITTSIVQIHDLGHRCGHHADVRSARIGAAIRCAVL